MKLLFFNTSGAWGGQEMFSGELFCMLREAGVDVRIALRPGYPLDRLLREAGHADRILNAATTRRYYDPVVDRMLRAEYRAQRVDLVHCFVSSDIPHATIAARFMGKDRPRFVHHLQMLPGHSRKNPFHRLTYRPLDRVVAITHQIADRVRRLWPVRPDRVKTIYYGIDAPQVAADQVAAVREKFGLAKQGPRIGLVGQICPIKGQLEVFRAFARVAADHPTATLTFAGTPTCDEPEYGAGLQREVERSGLADRVVFTGFCDEIPALLANFDTFALGSHHEPFGRVVIEAMAAGCVTIGTRAGGVPEIIDDGVDGLLYEARDVDGLERQLRKALTMTDAERGALVAAARAKVESRFGMPRFLSEMRALYDEVLSEAAR